MASACSDADAAIIGGLAAPVVPQDSFDVLVGVNSASEVTEIKAYVDGVLLTDETGNPTIEPPTTDPTGAWLWVFDLGAFDASPGGPIAPGPHTVRAVVSTVCGFTDADVSTTVTVSASDVFSDPFSADDDAIPDDDTEADPTPGDCTPDDELGADDFCDQSDDEPVEGPSGFAAGSPALAAGGSGWGIGDQHAPVFADARFQQLGTTKARYILTWNQVAAGVFATAIPPDQRNADQSLDAQRLAELDDWVAQAQAHGQEILLGFTQARDRAATKENEADYLPTPDEYKTSVEGTLRRYPGVHLLIAWNEVNFFRQPTSFEEPHGHGALGPRRAAQYWKEARNACRNVGRACTVAAGSFLDTKALNERKDDGKTYWRRYVEALHGSIPHYWAFHAYNSGRRNANGVNYLSQRFGRFLRRSGAYSPNSHVWVTEYGQRLDANEGGDDVFHGDMALRRVIDYAQRHDRVTRFYYYTWFNDTNRSGLLNSFGGFHCLYFVYRAVANPGSNTPPVQSGCPTGYSLDAPFAG
jgi:hypothetical protein